MSQHYIGADIDDISNRSSVHSYSIGKFLFFIFPLFIMFCLGVLNAFPLIPFGYGFVYHIPEFTGIIIFSSTYGYYIPALIISLLLSIILFVLDGFAAGFSLYSLLICYISSIPTDCINMQATLIVVSFFSVLLFFFSIMICMGMVPIVRKILRTKKYKRKT